MTKSTSKYDPLKEPFKPSWRDIFDKRKLLKREQLVNLAYQAETSQFLSMNLDRVKPDDYDPKIAELGSAFEQMKSHPLCRTFLRHDIDLYINKQMEFSFKSPNARHPGAKARKIIEIPQKIADLLSPVELQAVVGHEISHILRLDIHPKRVFGGRYRLNRKAEILADQVSVLLSNNPEALISALEKIREHTHQHLHDHMEYRYPGNPANGAAEKIQHWYEEIGNLAYPGFNKRLETIRKACEKIATPEGRAELEKDIATELRKEHNKLFPGQFSRVNSRA